MKSGNSVIYCKLLLICSVVFLGSFSIGGVVSFTYSAFPNIDKYFKNAWLLDGKEESWFISIVHIGIAVGAIFAGFASKTFGRKWTILIGTLPFMTGWLIMATSTHKIWIFIAQFLTGFCSGIMMTAVSAYAMEMSLEQSRGFFGSCHDAAINLGAVFTSFIAFLMVWQYVAITLAAIVVLMVILSVYFSPETPPWLMAIGHKDRAKNILAFIYKEPQATEIWDKMDANVENSSPNNNSFLSMFKTPLRKKLFVCVILFILQEFSGYNAYRAYSGPIFNLAEVHLNRHICDIIIFSVAFIGSIFCLCLSDKLKRRTLLMWSVIIICVSNMILGAYFYKLYDSSSPTLHWIPIVFLFVFTFSYSLALGPLPYVITIEAFPIALRMKACAIAIVCKGICGFLVCKYLVPLGIFADISFFIFGSVSFVGSLFIFILIPQIY